MPSTIEKEVIRKISDIGFAVPKARSLAEASEEDLNVLFTSLITVYDTSWTIDTTKKGKHVRVALMRYLRLLDLGHLIPSVDSLCPGNPSIIRCLSALTQKLDDKYGSRLQLRVRQTLKPKISKPRTTTTLQVTKPDDEYKQASRTPSRTPTLPKTPGSAHVKLLNGQPIVPGSELRGRELARSPPQEGTITPHVTRGVTKRTPSHLEGDGSPVTKAKRTPRSKPSKNVENLDSNPTDNPPHEPLRDLNYLEPKITDNVIPTGRQLGRTPPSSQESVASSHDDQQEGESCSMDSQLGQKGQPDKLATVLDFKEDPEDKDSAEQGSSEVGSAEIWSKEVLSSPQSPREILVKIGPPEDEEEGGGDERHIDRVTNSSVGNNSIVIPALQTESTPVTLTCPENLQCNQNDLEFLQIQENIRKLKELEKENAGLTKQIGEQAYKKDLLTAEYEEVKHEVTHVGEKIQDTKQVIRRALVDHTNGSPSVLAGSTKKTLLTGVHLKMAARASRLQAQVEKENAAHQEADDTLNNTTTLQTEHAKLEKVVRRLPVAVQHAEEELESVRQQLIQSQSGTSSSGQGVDHSRRTIHRLKVLRERIELAKQRKALLKQMNLR